MQYFETRCYGLNYIIKEYAGFPSWLPMPCHTEHGWTPLPNPLESDLLNDKPIMLVLNIRREKAWKEAKTKKDVYILGTPFIHYKNIHQIKKNRGAKGTVVFPSHSTYDLKSLYSPKKLCQELVKIPKKYKPITICLFWLDYIDHSSQIYKDYGFTVTSAGPKLNNSLDFVKNFYNILSSHKYATSNEVGSYTFLAIDLKIPFFLTGTEPVINNRGKRDVNINKDSAKMSDYVMGKKAMKLFSTGPVDKISKEQRNFVIAETGIKNCVSRKQLNKILWNGYRKNKYWFRAFLPYLIYSSLYFLFFNGPWIRIFIQLRKKIGKNENI